MINIDFYTDYEDKEKTDKYNEFLEKYKGKINNIIEQALTQNSINIENYYVGIGIVTPKRIQEMNKSFREVDKITDVLSFPIYEKDELAKLSQIDLKGEEISLGDIVICLEVIENQAIEYQTGFDREMLYMITHGICHLIGFDHMKQDEKKQMREMEEKILSKIGEI